MAQSTRDDTSVDIKALEKTIGDNLGSGSLLSDTSCIFRVPEVLRRNNTKAYQPDMVAIGPLHDRKQKQYQHMEKVKRWYLREYILSSNSKNKKLAELIAVVTKDETLVPARDCYAESLDSIKPDEFIEMMILDGCFIVELFRKFSAYKKQKCSDGSQPKKQKRSDGSQPKKDDPILTMDCMIQYICHDLLLLENQLPWVVLQNLYIYTQGDHDPSDCSLSELILHVFTFLPSVGNNNQAFFNYICNHNDANHKHILDLVRTSIICGADGKPQVPFDDGEPQMVPSDDGEPQLVPSDDGEPQVPSDDGESQVLSYVGETRRLQGAKKDDGKEIPPATTLSKGGVKFKRVSHNSQISIMNMEFEGGVLKIPQLAIGELTETLFRNLIAFEQCCQSRSHKITSYAAMMDKLIASKEDMEFLCKKKIIQNWLSAEDGFEFFNKLYNDTLLDKFYYKNLCGSVNGYYNVKCVRWMAIFWREYFHTPWTIISLFAATILLVLTLVQTIFTVHE